jgi:hypothetical protein
MSLALIRRSAGRAQIKDWVTTLRSAADNLEHAFLREP